MADAEADPPPDGKTYRGMLLTELSRDRWMWSDPGTTYLGCTYSTPEACRLVIDGLHRARAKGAQT